MDDIKYIEIIQLLLNHLPDNEYYEDPTWEYAWEELSNSAQEAVKAAGKVAWEFINENPTT